MLKKSLLSLSCIFIVTTAFTQEEISISVNSDVAFASKNETFTQSTIYQNQTDFKQHWSFGGNIGLSFWNGGTDILIGPKAYYNFTPKFLTGFGLTYMYTEYNSNVYGYHSNSVGGSLMAGYRPIYYLQLSIEYEGLQTNYSGYYSDEYFVNALYLGLSYVTGPVSFGIRYDVLFNSNSNNSLYGSAWNPFIGFYF
jgi:hypothetical protein